MSVQHGKLISLILQEYFGEVVHIVGGHLYKYGSCSLSNIVKSTNISVAKVKLVLSVLIKHDLLTFKPSRNETYAEYRLQSDRVLLLLRYPKYLFLIKNFFGDEAEMLLEEVLISGYISASSLILKVTKRQNENQESSVDMTFIKDKFISLVVAKYLQRLPQKCDDKPVPTFDSANEDLYKLPPINLGSINKCLKEGSEMSFEDSNVYWRADFDRFHQDFRDKALISAVTHRFDDNAGKLMNVMLQQMYVVTQPWAESSNPLGYFDLKCILDKLSSHDQLMAYLDHYLTVVADDDSGFVRKIGDANGGQYIINLKNAICQLSWAVLENLVLEKFGSKAARIFKLVRVKKFIEPDQIQQLAMIPAKEAKRLSYELLEENFVQLQELRKAPYNSGPNRSFVLFHVDVDRTVRMVLEMCYKSLYNMITRRQHNKCINKRIIDKKHRMDTIVMGLKMQGASDQHLADIEEMITPPEKELLDKIGKTMRKLNQVELEIDDTIFLLQLYLMYQHES